MLNSYNAAAVVLSMSAAVLSLVGVAAALRPVVAGPGILSLDPAGTVVGVSSAPVAAWAAEVIPCLVPGSCRVSFFGRRAGTVRPFVAALLIHNRVRAAPLASGVGLLSQQFLLPAVQAVSGGAGGGGGFQSIKFSVVGY